MDKQVFYPKVSGSIILCYSAHALNNMMTSIYIASNQVYIALVIGGVIFIVGICWLRKMPSISYVTKIGEVTKNV